MAKNNFLKTFIIVLTAVIALIFSLIPATNWLPFAEFFPPWIVETPLMWTFTQSAPLILTVFFITLLIVILKRFLLG